MELPNTHPALRRCWHPVALAGEVGDAPHAVRLMGEAWVVVRTADGVAAFEDRCPHRLAPLSAGRVVDDGTLHCAYHGWRFDGSGHCTLIPALGPGATLPPRARLRSAAAVAEHLGMIWIAPEEPLAPLPSVPQWARSGFRTGVLTPTTARVNAGLMLDNFLDVAHFPFLHAGTFGAGEGAEVGEQHIVREGWTVTSEEVQTFLNREDPAVATGERPLLQRRRATYRWTAPFVATLTLEYLDAAGTNVVVFAVQPLDTDRCRVYTTLLRDDVADDDAMADAIAFEQAVLDEDLVLQERITAALPLDPTTEVHTRADRLTLELRRTLAELVRTAGA